MIQGKDICKKFGDFKALDHAGFHVPKGAVYGLVGPNGAGKSTLLRHVAGIFRQDSGELLVDGENIFENPSAKSKIAFIPDDIFYFRQANLKEMKKYYEGIYATFDTELFDKLLECFPAVDRKRNIRRMSKGMQKQAAFLLAISCKPELLILDEPVDGLDPVMRRQIWNILLNAVSEEKMTVLVSSHNLRELEDVCDHVGIMHKGQVILERSLSDLQGSVTKLQMAFEGDELPDITGRFEVMNHTKLGKVHTLIVKGDQRELGDYLETFHPLVMDMLPLTLEEIFIYELGGENYEVKDIIL
ncbi:MAG: ABC transporter ATP-binding protein [Lachnospiraceae bacterium]|nr:ABC transporter ATP-binding protein [Lachnospiraceae bacterium]